MLSKIIQGSLSFLLGITLAWGVSAFARAEEWSPAAMNAAIDATNVEVEQHCSGTLISITEKLVLTNFHCIDDLVESFEKEVTDKNGYVKKVKQRRFKDARVDQHRYDGYEKVGSASFQGEIVAQDQMRDLAVIKLKGNIPHVYASPLIPADQVVARGERVYIVGNPAMNYGSVVEGIVSSVNRTFEFPWTNREKLPMIQFSGGIIGGNSGGALYNSKGQVIGVPAAGYPGSPIGLAVPVNTIVHSLLKDFCLLQGSALCTKKTDVKDEESK